MPLIEFSVIKLAIFFLHFPLVYSYGSRLSKQFLMLAYLCQFETNLNTPGKKESQLRNCFHQLVLWANLWGCCPNCCLMQEGPAHGQDHIWEHLDCIKKVVEQRHKAKDRKAISSVLPGSLLQLLSTLNSCLGFP